MLQTTEEKDALRKLISRAWADPDFKRSLISDPVRVLTAAGIAIDEERQWKVVEGDHAPVSDTTNAYFYLPLPPSDSSISDDELMRMSNAASCSSFTTNCRTNLHTCCCDITVAPRLFP